MKTILILEDDVIFSRSIGNWLKKKGMATEHAATLSAARKALSAREFDLVLADLRLPDGNSTSLLEWMNERFYATPFLIMTNYGQVENAVEAMQLGAVNYLCKPVQPDRLLEAIGKIFSRPRHDGNEFYRGEECQSAGNVPASGAGGTFRHFRAHSGSLRYGEGAYRPRAA